MKSKMKMGLILIICLAAFSFSAYAFAETSNEIPTSLKEGDDSLGAHQCPRDNYDDNTGPTNRNGFGDDFL